MKWLTLYNRIGKQPIGVTQKQDVVAVVNGQEYPMLLKFGTGKQKMWLVVDDRKTEENIECPVYKRQGNTYIIAFCPDTDEFFVTKDGGFYYEYPECFKSEASATDYVHQHLYEFIAIRNELMRECGQQPKDSIWLLTSQDEKQLTLKKENA